MTVKVTLCSRGNCDVASWRVDWTVAGEKSAAMDTLNRLKGSNARDAGWNAGESPKMTSKCENSDWIEGDGTRCEFMS